LPIRWNGQKHDSSVKCPSVDKAEGRGLRPNLLSLRITNFSNKGISLIGSKRKKKESWANDIFADKSKQKDKKR